MWSASSPTIIITRYTHSGSTLPQDPFSTLGRPDRRRKEASDLSSINDSINPQNFELKSDLHPISEFTATNKTETDLETNDKQLVDADSAVPDPTTNTKSEAQELLPSKNRPTEKKEKLKFDSNVDLDREVSDDGDINDDSEKNKITVINNPSASQEGKREIETDSIEESNVGGTCNCEVLATNFIPKL